MKKVTSIAGVLIYLIIAQGCATYTTPAAGVNINVLTDDNIAALLKVEPASEFPARIAVARVQASGYVSRTNAGYGKGRYSVITTRDIEDETDFEKLNSLSNVGGIAPLGRLLLPPTLETLKDLRISAARLKTDMLLVYTVDTTFHIEGTPLGPLSLVTLGFLPNKKAFVTSTTSGALIDVRTGYIYGVAEATGRQEQRTTTWNEQNAIDQARIDSETNSFKKFIDEFTRMWPEVAVQHIASNG